MRVKLVMAEPNLEYICRTALENIAKMQYLLQLTPNMLYELITKNNPQTESLFLQELKRQRIDLYSVIINTQNGIQWFNQHLV